MTIWIPLICFQVLEEFKSYNIETCCNALIVVINNSTEFNEFQHIVYIRQGFLKVGKREKKVTFLGYAFV